MGQIGEEMKSSRYTYPYLLALRFCHADWLLRNSNAKIGLNFSLKKGEELPNIPHITIFGPFRLKRGIHESDVFQSVQGAANGFSYLPYIINGWEKREGKNGCIIAHRIDPSNALIAFRSALVQSLSDIVHIDVDNVWDLSKEHFWYHSTAILNVPKEQCATIWKGLKHSDSIFDRIRSLFSEQYGTPENVMKGLYIPLETFRIAIFKSGHLFAEYDFGEKRVLLRNEALTLKKWRSSLHQYRCSAGMESHSRYHSGQTIYAIADTHFGHGNIIKYCARPFMTRLPEEMDAVMIQNWNSIVNKHEEVYFLGDLRYGSSATSAVDYLDRLNGHITFIKGNHDHRIENMLDYAMVQFQGYRFLLIHNPEDWEGQYNSWIIHGHFHDNDLTRYPFINFEHKTVNVCVETTRYSPISLQEIVDRIRAYEKNPEMENIPIREALPPAKCNEIW